MHPMFNLSPGHSDTALLNLNLEAHVKSKMSPLHLHCVDDRFLPRSSCKIMDWGFIHSNGVFIHSNGMLMVPQ